MAQVVAFPRETTLGRLNVVWKFLCVIIVGVTPRVSHFIFFPVIDGGRLVTSNDLHHLQLLDRPLNLRLRHHRFFSVVIPRKLGFVGEAMTGTVEDDPSGDPI
ncbi:hypothetical protein TB1_024027 [Malus domestica]